MTGWMPWVLMGGLLGLSHQRSGAGERRPADRVVSSWTAGGLLAAGLVAILSGCLLVLADWNAGRAATRSDANAAVEHARFASRINPLLPGYLLRTRRTSKLPPAGMTRQLTTSMRRMFASPQQRIASSQKRTPFSWSIRSEIGNASWRCWSRPKRLIPIMNPPRRVSTESARASRKRISDKILGHYPRFSLESRFLKA